MTYDANMAIVDLEIERLRPERRRHGPRNTNYQIPTIKMLRAHAGPACSFIPQCSGVLVELRIQIGVSFRSTNHPGNLSAREK